MGSKFEEIIEVSSTDYFERRLRDGEIEPDDRRLRNRALSRAGLQSDPLLFWHYDWGNQPYIKVKKALGQPVPDAAWYGYIGPPDWATPSPAPGP